MSEAPDGRINAFAVAAVPKKPKAAKKTAAAPAVAPVVEAPKVEEPVTESKPADEAG